MGVTAATVESGTTTTATGRSWRLSTFRSWVYALSALAAASLVFGALLYLALHDKETAAFYAARFFRAVGGYDSWRPMLRALYELHGNPDVPLYSHVFFDLNVKFQYPTSSLFLTDAVQRLIGAAPWRPTYTALNWLSWFAVWGIGILCWRLFLASYRETGGTEPATRLDTFALLGAALAVTVFFYPLTLSFVLGQIQTAMTLLLALALLVWPRSRGWAGVLIGLCCAVKPQWAVVLAWGALRREWVMVRTGTATVAALLILSGAAYGFANHLDYVKVLSFLSQYGESYYLNQSVNGLMNRFLSTGDNVDHNEFGKGFPEFHPLVYAATLISTAAILLAALAFRRRARPGRFDFALIVLSVTIASPIAWVHHYAVLLPIFALLAPACVAERPFGRWSVAYVLIAFILASQRFAAADQWAYTHWNVVQSHLLFGAMMVLVLLYRMAGITRSPQREVVT